MKEIDRLSIATIRSLCIDITNKANSGHPGMPLGMAPTLYTLFTKHFNASPLDSKWFNRDRFVLSAGHASALLYSVLHLSGYKISIDDLKSFRQLNSITPGHPEYGETDGVDATSGPLGQGIGQAVGMAVAEQFVQASYSSGNVLCDHYTYVMCGDGCLQEGVSQEAISFAGHQHLNKLILIYDSNNVTLDGSLDLSFSEDVNQRFIASGWNILEVKDGNDVDEIDKAISLAKQSKDKPTMIRVHTIIGYGASKQGTNKVHGSPIGMEDGHKTKVESYGFDHEDFFVPEEVYLHFKETFINRGNKILDEYLKKLEKYGKEYPKDYERFISLKDLDTSKYLPDVLPNLEEGSKLATRVASGKALNALTLSLPNLFGGSADVASSVMTKLDNGENFSPSSRSGHNINFGIREFAMGCIQNGILLHGGVRTYIGCFFVFSDYMKPAIRMAALSKLPAIYIFSHDSLALGEDGSTHQPVEQLAMLRSMPNIKVIRPCDERETYASWLIALKSINEPTALILSRQGLPLLKTSSKEGVEKGGYVISKEQQRNDFTLIATGSEVSLALAVQELLLEKGVDTRVVSLPSWELFEKQSEEYQNEVFSNPYEKRMSLEMLSTFGWDKWCKYHMGIDTFGASAPIKDIMVKFSFTKEKVMENVMKALGK